jgi:hypothetical protein
MKNITERRKAGSNLGVANPPLTDVCLANVPAGGLALLATIRCVPGVYVVAEGDRFWIRWESADDQVLRTVLPVPGVRLYVRRQDRWYPAGGALPAFDVPDQLPGKPLVGVLLPARAEPVPPPSGELQPVSLRLIPDHSPRMVTACLCTPAELQQWADTVSVQRLAGLQAACCEGQVLLLGKKLPLFREGRRFWGGRILAPVGWRPDPLLPESSLTEAVGLQEGEFLLWQEERVEVVPQAACQPLTRTRCRLLKQNHEAGA